MNPTQPNQSDPRSLSDADERAIDALLDELQQRTPTPPDLSASILQQLGRLDLDRWPASTDVAPPSFADQSVRPVAPAAKKRPRRRLLRAMGALALAASIALLLGRWQRLSPDDGARPGSGAIARWTVPSDDRSLPPKHDEPQSPLAKRTPRPFDIAKKIVPRQGVPLVRTQPLRVDQDVAVAKAPEPQPMSPNEPPLPADDTVLVRFNASLADYWNRLGVVPAQPLSQVDVAQRIEQRFGSSPAFDDQAQITKFAEKLIDRLMRNVPLAADARTKMVQQASQVIQQGERFDDLVSNWINDPSLFKSEEPDQLSQGLATNLLGVDAACARCHDSPVDGRFAQHDYWSLASVFARPETPPLFYELPDGRQRLADPRVPQRWLGHLATTAETTLTTKAQFARSLSGSPALAGALANRLWEIGFGAPLVSLASDPVAPPRDDALQTSHQTLTQAIVANNFDIRAAARVVMSSDAMQRGPSDLYQSGRWRMASDDAIAKDSLSQRVFAAAAPSRPPAGRDDLLAMMETRIGNTPRALGSTPSLLAQPNVSSGDAAGSDARQEKPKAEEYWWAQWIADREWLRGSWLHWIKNAEQQQRHALYAANDRATNDADELVTRLGILAGEGAAPVDDVTDRLFWVLRKSR